MIDREMVDHVRNALVRKDQEAPGEVPDYDVLAEAAVVAMLELVAQRAIAGLKRNMAENQR